MARSSKKRIVNVPLILTIVFAMVAAPVLVSFHGVSNYGNASFSPGDVIAYNSNETASHSTASANTTLLGHVSPNHLYQGEPAPMGITDYGYTQQSGAYKYNTTSFLGTVNIRSLYVYNATSGSNATSFQLNLILSFTHSGTVYNYWVQNVALVNTSTSGSQDYISFIDNVWNFSSTSYSIFPSTLNGNGTVYSNELYYDYASSTLSGNQVTLKTPLEIQLKEVSVVDSNGAPEVIMMYNDGSGWVTYDNIYFTFALNPSADSGFVVSGYSYNLINTFYDAEMIMGGPGGGSNTQVQSGLLNFTLQYWNGHNYQFIPGAWNFGSNTAEGVSNSSMSFAASVGNATLSSSMVPGQGSLDELYSLSSLGVINVTLPFASGTAYVNNITYSFEKYGLNLTLPPGLYNLTFKSSSGLKDLKGSFYVGAGQTLNLDPASFAKKYNVTITEKGLMPGTYWNITLQNGTVLNSTASTITVYLSNGTYNITPRSTSNYTYLNTTATVVVNGASAQKTLIFTRLYQVTFQREGINGVEWFVNLSSVIKHNLSNNITFEVLNGSYNYSVSFVKDYHAVPSNGVIRVDGSSVTVKVKYILDNYSIKLIETGLPNGYNWSVFIDGAWHYSNETTMYLNLTNGSYAFVAQGLNGSFTPASTNDTLVVNGHNETVQIALKSAYNTGPDLDYKLVYEAFLIGISVSGAIVIRRR